MYEDLCAQIRASLTVNARVYVESSLIAGINYLIAQYSNCNHIFVT